MRSFVDRLNSETSFLDQLLFLYLLILLSGYFPRNLIVNSGEKHLNYNIIYDKHNIRKNFKLKSLFKKICIGSDHAGFSIKEYIKNLLINENISGIDAGPLEDQSVDYPDYAKKVAKRVKSKKSDIGILVCGTGIGMSMTANRYKGIRAAVCHNIKSSVMSRAHNNANIICLGARLTSKNDIKKITFTFLKTKFEKGRHKRRINKF